MKYVFITSLFILSFLSLTRAQGEIDDEQKALIRNERSYHLSLNSNGWGGGFTYGKMINIYRKKLYSIELVTIKDAKELKINNPYEPDYRRFVFGKNNIFYNFRFGYGHLFKLYSKKDKGGIEVRWFYNVGPLLGMLKPVYYVTDSDPYTTEKFNSSLHTASSILGGAPYFKGFSEISVVPGAFVKVGSSFEFSKKDLQINALESGLTLDLFPKKIDLMANNKNQFYFLALFVSYRFGKIINPHAIVKKPVEDEIVD